MFKRLFTFVPLAFLLLCSCQRKPYGYEFKEIYSRYIDNIVCNEGAEEATPSGVFSGDDIIYSCSGNTTKSAAELLEEFDKLDKSYAIHQVPDRDTSVGRKVYKFSDEKAVWMYTNKDKVTLLGIWHLSKKIQ